MPQGLQVFDENAVLQVDLTDRLGSIVDYFEVSANGSRTYPQVGDKELFATYLGIYPGVGDSFPPLPSWTAPVLDVNQTTKTVSWTYFTLGTAVRNNSIIIVGAR